MTEPRIAAVSAGLSVPSSTRLLADRLTEAAGRALRERGAAPAAEVIELRDHAHALTDNLLTGFPSGDLKAAVDAASRADGLIAVTPIFNASYSGLFKTFFDVLEEGALQGTRCSSPPPAGRRATRWPWSTPSGRCSPTCAR